MSLLKKGESITQAVDRLYFSENASLQTEYKRLFASLFKSPEPYLEIVRVLATNRKGMARDEILRELGKKTMVTSRSICKTSLSAILCAIIL